MSNPNSWLSVEVINQTGIDITDVTLKHRYDTDHYDEKTWPKIENEARVGGLQVGFWTGIGRTGYDYWQIFFNCEGATFTCKDNFYCYLTKDDAESGGVVQIKLTLSKMYVEPPKSKGDHVSLSKSGILMANRDHGFYNIAHMVNTKKAIEWAIPKGANGLEADLNFDKAGNPTEYKHGGWVSDCTCNPSPSCDHVCKVVSRDDSTKASDLLNYIASYPSVALHVVDTKMEDGVDQKAAGVNVIKLLEKELFSVGYKGNVIVGVGDTKYIEYIKAAADQAAASRYKARISFTFDGEGNDYQKVFDALRKINSVYRAYGTGVTVCSPKTYYDATTNGFVAEHRAFHGLTYIWTLDSQNSMRTYLANGVRGIMTNMPSVLRELLEVSGIALAKPETPIPPAILLVEFLDIYCGSAIYVDGDYVYFAGGSDRNELWRRKKDGKKSSEKIDPHCGSAIYVDGDYVYFAGGSDCNELWRRKKDGKESSEKIDPHCGSAIYIDGDYVYFAGGSDCNELWRRKKDGKESSEKIDPHCGSAIYIDGDYVYFAGGSERNELWRRKFN